MKLAQLNHLRAVFFDLDGTLIDSAIDIYRSINVALLALGRPTVTEQQVRCWVGRGAPQLVQCVIKYQHEQEISLQCIDDKASITSDGSLQCSLKDQRLQGQLEQQEQQLLSAFLDDYQKNVCVDSRVYDGVTEFIQACQAQNLKLACITNKPYQPAHQLLSALDLLSPFELLLGGDSVSHKKPHPMSLLQALKHFDLEAHEVLMIGDSRNDVEAAHAAGMQCIALTYGYNHGEPVADCQPDLVIDSLYELL